MGYGYASAEGLERGLTTTDDNLRPVRARLSVVHERASQYGTYDKFRTPEVWHSLVPDPDPDRDRDPDPNRDLSNNSGLDPDLRSDSGPVPDRDLRNNSGPDPDPDLRSDSSPDPDPDLSDDPDPDPKDHLYVLGERCAEAYMQADALHYEAMRLLAEFDRRQGWEDTGFSSTAEWLAWRIGIKPGAARERLRTALALERLPATSEAMKSGEISFTKVRALTRVASPDNEETLLELARAGSAANLERVVRGWRSLDRRSEVRVEQIRYASRTLSAFVDEDGMIVVRGRLDPEAGAMLMRAVEAAADALFRRRATEGARDHGSEDEPTPSQRRADALGLVAERALAAGFTDAGSPISGSRADRTQVVLHVDADTLAEGVEPGRSELEDGTRVSDPIKRLASVGESEIG